MRERRRKEDGTDADRCTGICEGVQRDVKTMKEGEREREDEENRPIYLSHLEGRRRTNTFLALGHLIRTNERKKENEEDIHQHREASSAECRPLLIPLAPPLLLLDDEYVVLHFSFEKEW